MPDILHPLPDEYVETRGSLHRLAVYVISTARERTDGRIRLRPTPGGFGFGPVGDDSLSVRVDGTMLVVERIGAETSAPITSIAAAGALIGVEPDLGKEERFDVPPHGDVDAALPMDAEAAAALARWYRVGLAALEGLHAETGADDEIVLWPEHFDLAFSEGDEAARRRLTFGASPGDANHVEPYAYVLPWADPGTGAFWNAVGFTGAVLPYAALVEAPHPDQAIRAFFREGRRLVAEAAR